MSDQEYPTAVAKLNPQGWSRWKSGHPWIYRTGVTVIEERTGEEPLAQVLDPRGEVLGQALLSRESQITLRRLTRTPEPVGRELLATRIREAIAYRERIFSRRDAVRLVFGESDGLPGLVVDRYGTHIVLQTLSWGMAVLQDEIVEILMEELTPESVLARNDPSVRTLEGLPRGVEQIVGTTPENVTFHEGDLVIVTDLVGGQKTGAFLDQTENHLLAGQLSKGRVLDGFSYTGGFGLAAAGAADEVVMVETSKAARKSARMNAKRNGIDNVSFVDDNMFDYLKRADKENARFDVVILDPPAFAKNKKELDGALRGYKEINLRAMKILRPGGILITCSCSYHLRENLMDEVLTRAQADAGRSFRILERRQQSPDHPVLLGFPESVYLKCQVLERLD